MKIYAKEIYTEKGCMEGVLTVEEGRFQQIQEGIHTSDQDFSQYKILPGLIDVHTHGFKTYKSQSVDLDNYIHLCKVMASQGVTSFLVTMGEHNPQEFKELEVVSQAIAQKPEGAQMLGIHMEGPFLNRKKKGSFSDDEILDLDLDIMKKYIEASHGNIRYVTFAPELDEQGTFINLLKHNNIRVGGVHTDATYKEYAKAIQYGLDSSAHTGNGMSQIDRRDVHALGASLLASNLYCEIICDLIHLSKEMLQIIFRLKSDDRLIMISDSGQLAGMPPGKYKIHSQIRIVQDDGKIVLENGQIAGSSKTLLWDVKNLYQEMQIPIEKLLKMAALNPACFMGVDDRKGSIHEGKDADFILVDDNWQLVMTFVKGRCVYHRDYDSIQYDFEKIEKLD